MPQGASPQNSEKRGNGSQGRLLPTSHKSATFAAVALDSVPRASSSTAAKASQPRAGNAVTTSRHCNDARLRVLLECELHCDFKVRDKACAVKALESLLRSVTQETSLCIALQGVLGLLPVLSKPGPDGGKAKNAVASDIEQEWLPFAP